MVSVTRTIFSAASSTDEKTPQATAASWGDRRVANAPEVVSGQAVRLPALIKAAEENGLGYNLVAGANIAGFAKVADAMIAQGII